MVTILLFDFLQDQFVFVHDVVRDFILHNQTYAQFWDE